MKKYVTILFLLIPSLLIGQSDDSYVEDINPFRIGLKFGLPNVAGLSLEYVTPLLNNRIAPYADFSFIPIEDVEGTFFEIGSNIYFNSKGRGGYIGLGYGNLDVEVSNLSGETDDGRIYTNGIAKETITSFSTKIGGKSGRKLYFRIEGGYAFGDLPSDTDIIAKVDGQIEIINVAYSELFEYISGNGYALFNLGIGYSF